MDQPLPAHEWWADEKHQFGLWCNCTQHLTADRANALELVALMAERLVTLRGEGTLHATLGLEAAVAALNKIN